jgi:esterase/lipase superfamily enzyme
VVDSVLGIFGIVHFDVFLAARSSRFHVLMRFFYRSICTRGGFSLEEVTVNRNVFLLLDRSCPRRGWVVWALVAGLWLILTACSTNKPYQIELMPAPHVYGNGIVDPFIDIDGVGPEDVPYQGVLYATDRKPGGEKTDLYKNERGFLLRLGVANISMGKGDLDWEEARRISISKNRGGKYPLKVTHVKELGVLDRTLSELVEEPRGPVIDPTQPGREFAALVNEKLKISHRKEILVYVHGYKVVFDNPILVTTELWHFLGYDGVAIAYAWPSTPSRWAYASDLETAAVTSHNLRIFLEYLAEETDAERINIVGYSAGTRVVISALAQMALGHFHEDRETVQRNLHLGRVILVGSDYDRALFAANINDGLLKLPTSVTIYASESDVALDISRWLFRRDRLGQMFRERPLRPAVDAYLRKMKNLHLIDVTNAEEADAGNGHAYFRKSPWVSSDILVSLMYDLDPMERGLSILPDLPVWHFPGDYIERLKSVLTEINPEYKRAFEGEKEGEQTE